MQWKCSEFSLIAFIELKVLNKRISWKPSPEMESQAHTLLMPTHQAVPEATVQQADVSQRGPINVSALRVLG